MAHTVSDFITTENKPPKQRSCLLDTIDLHFLPPQKEKLGSRGFLFTFFPIPPIICLFTYER